VAGVALGAGVRTWLAVATRLPGGLEVVDEVKWLGRGLGVTLWSAGGTLAFRWAVGAGVLTTAGVLGLAFGRGAAASDMGGEGGS
jgi:hypothetical protein